MFNILLFFLFFIFLNSQIEKLLDYESQSYFLSRCNFFYKKNNINIEKIKKEGILFEFEDFETSYKSKKIETCSEERIFFQNVDFGRPITLLGCSYAFGDGIKREHSFPATLARNSNKTVYNFSLCGGQALQSLSALKDSSPEIYSNVKKSSYFIYLYMYDHINRYLGISFIYNYYDKLFFVPDNKNYKKLIQIPIIRFLCSGYQLKRLVKGFPFNDKCEIFLKKVMMYLIKEIKNIAPNSKIIFILYNEKIPKPKEERYINNEIFHNTKIINSKIWDELEKETNGYVQIVRTKDIMGFSFDYRYKVEDNHPNAKAWREFTPKFVSKYIK